ncbi:MAG: permease [Spirochaetes bacterium]|nr:permease [Spirochaetota bacterium]
MIAGAGFLASLLKDRGKTAKALKKALKAFESILPQFLVVLILVAITLAVLDTATISRYLGSGSGPLGIIIAALVGAITLKPGFVAFPVAAALLNAGTGATQIAAFVSSLMMVGIVTLPMEMKYFGRRAALLRNSFAFIFSFVAAIFVGWVVGL